MSEADLAAFRDLFEATTATASAVSVPGARPMVYTALIQHHAPAAVLHVEDPALHAAAAAYANAWSRFTFRGYFAISRLGLEVREHGGGGMLVLLLHATVPNAEEQSPRPHPLTVSAIAQLGGRMDDLLADAGDIARRELSALMRKWWDHELRESVQTPDGWLFGSPDSEHSTPTKRLGEL
jgi:hypothetical protein